MLNLPALCRQVADLTRRAGAFIRQESVAFDRSRIEYKGQSDLVSYVDRETEQMLVAGLRNLLPEAGFITEEGTAEGLAAGTDSGAFWIIDPLDGTTNFLHGIPCYSVSVALEIGGELVLGVVYEVSRDECFTATRGGGAFLNEAPLLVTPQATLERSLLATGFPYTMFRGLDQYLRILAYFMEHTHGIRRLGSAAVDLAYVAAGRFEGFFEYNLNAYDVAAGILLVREAGGLVTTFGGGPGAVHGREVVAGAPGVHGAMLAAISEFWQPEPLTDH